MRHASADIHSEVNRARTVQAVPPPSVLEGYVSSRDTRSTMSGLAPRQSTPASILVLRGGRHLVSVPQRCPSRETHQSLPDETLSVPQANHPSGFRTQVRHSFWIPPEWRRSRFRVSVFGVPVLPSLSESNLSSHSWSWTVQGILEVVGRGMAWKVDVFLHEGTGASRATSEWTVSLES